MVANEIAPLDEEFHAEVGRHPSGDRFKHTERQIEILGTLKAKAKERGLWNLWLTDSERGYGLTTVEYAYLAEEMGKVGIAAEVFNCSAPDTGNMEVLERYGTEAHKERWLRPLLEGEIRSAYVMTEPGVASSDATNISLSAVRDGGHYVLNGEKYWASGAGDPRCRLMIVMGRTDPSPDAPKHARHSTFLVRRRHAGHRGAAADDGVQQRRRAARPHAPALHRREGPGRGPGARRGARVRGRTRAAGTRPHPPLHARDRPVRERAGADVQARPVARRVRQAARRARRRITTSSPPRAWRSRWRASCASRRRG